MIWIEICAVVVIWLSLWSLIPRDEWWFRGADFPRLQILAVGLVTLLGLLLIKSEWTLFRELLLVGLIAAVAYQLKMVLPYTPIWKKQVKHVTKQQLNESQQISLLVANVLTPNDKYELLLQHIYQLQPDIVLTLESDELWQKALQPIEQEYRYKVAVPLNNLYGMHLYSRFPLLESEIKFILSDEIPSIHACLELRSGVQVQLYCLHPKPRC